MLQFTVIMAILLIWALTSLLSREAQPLPPRTRRVPGPDMDRGVPAARPTAGPARYLAAEKPVGATPERRPPARIELASGLGRPIAADEGIIILESDMRPKSQPAGLSATAAGSGARLARGSPSRRGARGRSSGAGAGKPADSARPRALTSLVTQSMAEKKARPLEIAPLGSPLAPINSPLHQIIGAATTLDPSKVPAPIPAVSPAALRSMLAAPTRLREAFLVSEILQPPVAMRRARRV